MFCFLIFAHANISPIYANTISMDFLNEDGSVYDTTTCNIGGDIELPTPPTKRGYTFQGWQIFVYTPVEYLESSGTQYINTNFVPNSDTKVQISFNTSEGSLNQAIFGARSADGTLTRNRYEYTIWVATGQDTPKKARFDYSGSGLVNTQYATTVISSSLVFTILKNKQYNYINGSTMTNNAAATFSCFYPAYLFALNQADTPVYFTHGKIYSCKLYDNEILVRDFIPVLDTNGTPCMYDKVNNQFYYNAGTGNFIAGPAITE